MPHPRKLPRRQANPHFLSTHPQLPQPSWIHVLAIDHTAKLIHTSSQVTSLSHVTSSQATTPSGQFTLPHNSPTTAISHILAIYHTIRLIHTSPQLSHMSLHVFQSAFTDTLSWKFAIKISLQISPHLNGVATLPCEILVYKNRIDWKHSNGRRGVRIVKRMWLR